MDRLQHAHAVVYEIYLSSPLCIAVLLNNRAFWTPSSPTPKIFERQELPTHLFDRGAIMIVLGVAFVFFAQAVFARLEGNFAEKL
jgi:ABC-2 type transport system permease protein